MQEQATDRVIEQLEQRILQLERDNSGLASGHARLRAILDNEPECVKLLAADGSLLEMNPAGLRMIEADSLEEVRNQCVYPLIVEEHRAAFRSLNERVLAGGSGVLEFEIVGLKGGRRWMETHASPLRDAAGSVTAALGLTRDITGRKHAEAERADLLAREHAAKKQVDRILESVSDAFVALDKDWRYTYVNRRAGEIFQRRPEDLIGKHIWTEFPEGLGQPFHHAYEKAFAEQVAQTIEEYYPPYDTWFENRIYPHPDGMSIVFQDITSRKRSERALQESEQRLQDAQRIGRIGDWTLDIATGRVSWSPQAYALYERDPALGPPSFEEYLAGKDAENRDIVERNIARLLESGRQQSYEVQMNLPSGKRAYHAVIAVPLLDDIGRVTGVRGVVQDIGERKQAEQALLARETQLGLIYENVADAVFLLEVTTEEFRFVSVNASFLAATGLGLSQVVGKRVNEVIPEPALSTALEHYARAADSGQPVHWEEVSAYPSGTRYGEVTVAPVMDSDGRCRQLIGTVRDVTARMQAKQKLLDAALRQQSLARRLVEVQEAEQRHLSAELHDRIGQNLTALSINLNIIGSRNGQAHMEATAARLEDSRKLLETTITSVRDLITELRPPALDDYGLLAGLRWFGEQLHARTGLRISVLGEEPSPRLEPEKENALFRIAQEALTNIVKHAQAQRVGLTLQREAGTVTLSIADDGCGFDPPTLQRPGLRAHWGLEMMGERAEAVGARLRVESTPGQGTRIVVDVEIAP